MLITPHQCRRRAHHQYCGVVSGEAILGANVFRTCSPVYVIW